jgi:hypothetical protein
MISKADIEQAYAAIRSYIVRTPLVYSRKLSDLSGCQTFFKLENFQLADFRISLKRVISLCSLWLDSDQTQNEGRGKR